MARLLHLLYVWSLIALVWLVLFVMTGLPFAWKCP